MSKSQKRPAIPQALKYRVLLEAGFKCAFPSCAYPDVDVHHIRDWAKVRKHEYENLIALCPNHHRRAGQGKISIKALNLLKAKLQIQFGLPVTSVDASGLWSTCSLFVSDIPRYEVAIEFPQLHAKANVAIPEINAVLYAKALAWVHDLRAQELFHENPFDPAVRFALIDPDNPLDEATKTRIREDWLASKDGLIVSYEMWMPSKSIVSVRFNLYSCVHAAAHPNRWVETFTYMINPAAPLRLSDILREEKSGIKFLCDFVRSEIRKFRKVNETDDYFSYPVAEPIPENPFWYDETLRKLRNFVLTDQHLVLLFEPYEIASYADGGYEVWIPYKLLRPYINPKGPLKEVLGNSMDTNGARRRVCHF